MSDFIRSFSVRLYEILEHAGVSERIRHLHQVNSIVKQITDTLICRYVEGNNSSIRVFGSAIEGTTSPDLNADLDILYCYDGISISEDREPYSTSENNAFIMIRDETTNPGYVKLQILIGGRKQSDYAILDDTIGSDSYGRVCLKHIFQISVEQIGPAVSLGHRVLPTDIVFAQICRIPSFASSWVSRPMIRQRYPHFQYMGCMLLPVGCKSSSEQHLEWRISFSLQERELMMNLNATQHKCYVLLKMIAKDCINVHERLITSYHCKTCLFYVIESSGEEVWFPENLIRLTMICLSFLRQWIRDRNCPDYFIPNQNLFETLLNNEQTRTRLSRTITNLLRDGWTSFLRIRCDNVGEKLLSLTRLTNSEKVIQNYEYSLMVHFCKNLVEFKKQMHLLSQNVNNPNHALDMLHEIIIVLQNIRNNISEDAIVDAVSCLEPSVNLQIAKRLAETLSRMDNEITIPRERILDMCLEHFRQSNSSDLMNIRLLFVSLLFSCRQNEACLEILEDIETKLTPAVISVCSCSKSAHTANNTLRDKFSGNQLSLQNIIQSSVASCVIFQPVDNNIIPFPLKLEMFRSLGTPDGSRNEFLDFWFDWAVVDAMVYLYFMQYMVCSELSMDTQKKVAIDNIKWVIREEPNLGHRETAYNLLGWMYKQEGDLRKACWCFTESLKIRPLHNAAKWHEQYILSEYNVISRSTINYK